MDTIELPADIQARTIGMSGRDLAILAAKVVFVASWICGEEGVWSGAARPSSLADFSSETLACFYFVIDNIGITEWVEDLFQALVEFCFTFARSFRHDAQWTYGVLFEFNQKLIEFSRRQDGDAGDGVSEITMEFFRSLRLPTCTYK